MSGGELQLCLLVCVVTLARAFILVLANITELHSALAHSELLPVGDLLLLTLSPSFSLSPSLSLCLPPFPFPAPGSSVLCAMC